ncbi:MAG TPA: sigma-70 family RNA polymerase sigma factor [Gemmataceae bacterium]|nr:sigma-70 family RNA polymerase sigma factor [Gemmataceae bacterium]
MPTGQASEAGQDPVSGMAARPDEAPSDGQLLERYVKERDERAFAMLVERYSGLVFGVCQRVLGDRHYAEDAFQATFLVLVRRADSLDGERALGNWLYAVAYRTAVKARAIAARRRVRERQAWDMSTAEAGVAPEINDLKPIIDEALNELPEKYRAPLVLCCLQGKTHQEAAEQLGWPSGSMSRRMEKARKLLRKRLAQRGVVLSAAVLLPALLQKATAASASASLISGTVQAAMAFGAGAATTASVISSDVAVLADAVLKTTTAHKWKIGASLAAAAGILLVLALGTGIFYSDQIVARTAARPTYVPHIVQSTGPGGFLAGWHLNNTLESDFDEVLSISLAPSGKTLAFSSREENWIRTWDLASGHEQPRLRGHTASIHAVVFSPNGRLLASASEDSTVRLWMFPGGTPVATLRGHKAGVLTAAFSLSGNLLASGGLDETVHVWDLATQRTSWTLSGHSGPIFALAFSADGQTLVSAGKDGTLKTWDMKTGQALHTLEGHSAPVCCLALSPDGKTLASGSWDRTIKLWDWPSGQVRAELPGHANQVLSLAFTSSGQLLMSSGKDKTVKVWQVSVKRELASLQGHSGSVNALALARDGVTMVTGSSDQTIRFWNMDDWLQELE